MVVSTAIYPSLFDKVVLITGGAEGIGAAAVKSFCRQGSKVAFFDISEASSKALIEDIKKLQVADESGRYTIPTFYQCDVTDLDQLKQNADKVLRDFGTVNVLVNSAAAAGAKSRVPSSQVTPESWDLRCKRQPPTRLFPFTGYHPSNAEAKVRQHHQYGLNQLANSCRGDTDLYRLQSSYHGTYEDAFEGVWQRRD